MEKDALSTYKFKEGGGGDLYTKIKEGEPQKLRVLTLDPVVHIDNFGNTRYAFVVYNYTQSKAQILDKGTSIAKALADLHNDEDYAALNKIDIKITATGEGMETRYSVNVLPKTETLTTDQIKECTAIKLPEGTRMSELNDGAPLKTIQVDEPEITDEDMDAPINLNDIPFN